MKCFQLEYMAKITNIKQKERNRGVRESRREKMRQRNNRKE